jgi:hypothetical protein
LEVKLEVAELVIGPMTVTAIKAAIDNSAIIANG